MFFNEDYIQITKVRTNDGVSPVIGEDGRVATKIIFAPVNPLAKKLLEEQNSRLPNQLKMKIEVKKAYKPEPVQPVVDTSAIDALNLKILALEQENKKLKEVPIPDPLPLVSENGSSTATKTAQHEKK